MHQTLVIPLAKRHPEIGSWVPTFVGMTAWVVMAIIDNLASLRAVAI